jgi:hypothetical protein
MAAQKVTKNAKGKALGISVWWTGQISKAGKPGRFTYFWAARMLARLADKSQAIKAFAQ